MKPLERNTFQAEELARLFPPQWRNRNKEIVYEIACSSGDPFDLKWGISDGNQGQEQAADTTLLHKRGYIFCEAASLTCSLANSAAFYCFLLDIFRLGATLWIF